MATISSELTKTFIEKSKLKHNDIFDIKYLYLYKYK